MIAKWFLVGLVTLIVLGVTIGFACEEYALFEGWGAKTYFAKRLRLVLEMFLLIALLIFTALVGYVTCKIIGTPT